MMVARRDDERGYDHPQERKNRDLGKFRAARASEHRMRGRKGALQAHYSIQDNPPVAVTRGARTVGALCNYGNVRGREMDLHR